MRTIRLATGGVVRRLGVGPDGRTLRAVLGDDEGAAALVTYDLAAGRVVGQGPLGVAGDAVPDPAWSADLRVFARLVSAGDPHPWWHAVELTDLSGRTPPRLAVSPEGSGHSFYELVLSRDGRWLAAADRENEHGDQLFVWDLSAAGAELTPVNEDDPAWTEAHGSRPAFAPDGSELAVYDWEDVRRFEPDTMESLEPLPWPDGCDVHEEFEEAGAVAGLAYTPAADRLALAGAGAVVVWDVARARPRLARRKGGANATAVAMHPAGRLFAVADDAGGLSFHDPDDGRERSRLAWGGGPLRSAAFAPDGLTVLAGGTDGQVVIWDVEG